MIYVFDFDGTLAKATFTDVKGKVMDIPNTADELAYRDCCKNVYENNGGIKVIIEYVKKLVDSDNTVVVLTKINDTLEFDYKKAWLKQQFGRPVDYNSNFYAVGVGTLEGKCGVLTYLLEKDNIIYFDDSLECLLKLESYIDKLLFSNEAQFIHTSVLYDSLTR